VIFAALCDIPFICRAGTINPDGREGQEAVKMMYAKVLRFIIKIIGSLLFAALVFLPVSGMAKQNGAEEAVKRFNSALLENMKRADELGFHGRYKLLDPMLRDVFALHFMGEKSLGSHWKDLSPEQRKRYLDLYADWTISSYAGNFDGYSGERFEIEDIEQSKGDFVIVISNLVIPNKESVAFHYSLRRFQDGWRIVDITIEDVSQLSLTRSQFISVFKKKGFDGLLAALQDKIAVIQARGIDEKK
jgi:phospholipid transport system substrate-binding protein